MDITFRLLPVELDPDREYRARAHRRSAKITGWAMVLNVRLFTIQQVQRQAGNSLDLFGLKALAAERLT
jgi:hypothetical protein